MLLCECDYFFFKHATYSSGAEPCGRGKILKIVSNIFGRSKAKREQDRWQGPTLEYRTIGLWSSVNWSVPEPVAGRGRRIARTVLTRMTGVEGPLALLQKCMDQRIRVKVGWTGGSGWEMEVGICQ